MTESLGIQINHCFNNGLICRGACVLFERILNGGVNLHLGPTTVSPKYIVFIYKVLSNLHFSTSFLNRNEVEKCGIEGLRII